MSTKFVVKLTFGDAEALSKYICSLVTKSLNLAESSLATEQKQAAVKKQKAAKYGSADVVMILSPEFMNGTLEETDCNRKVY